MAAGRSFDRVISLGEVDHSSRSKAAQHRRRRDFTWQSDQYNLLVDCTMEPCCLPQRTPGATVILSRRLVTPLAIFMRIFDEGFLEALRQVHQFSQHVCLAECFLLKRLQRKGLLGDFRSVMQYYAYCVYIQAHSVRRHRGQGDGQCREAYDEARTFFLQSLHGFDSSSVILV